jgi:hypothetical protein
MATTMHVRHTLNHVSFPVIQIEHMSERTMPTIDEKNIIKVNAAIIFMLFRIYLRYLPLLLRVLEMPNLCLSFCLSLV